MHPYRGRRIENDRRAKTRHCGFCTGCSSRHQKVQKALITVAKTLLVFFTVIGGTAILKGVPTDP